MLLELIAVLCTGLFTGAAIYVNLVEHPARVQVGTAAAVNEWRSSYPRGTVMQASLAVAGFLSSLGAWLQGRGTPVLIAGLLIGLVVPSRRTEHGGVRCLHGAAPPSGCAAMKPGLGRIPFVRQRRSVLHTSFPFVRQRGRRSLTVAR